MNDSSLLRRRIANQEEQIRELTEALEGILDIGKRDTTNPKYDGYYRTAKEVIEKYRVK